MEYPTSRPLAIFVCSLCETWAFPKAHLIQIAMVRRRDGLEAKIKFPIRTVTISGLADVEGRLEEELFSDGHTVFYAKQFAKRREYYAQKGIACISVITINTSDE